jgi:hypothetical protein
MKARMFFSLLIATLLVLAGWEAQAQGFVKKVNCTKGQTIARALQGLDFIPITIQIKGTCGPIGRNSNRSRPKFTHDQRQGVSHSDRWPYGDRGGPTGNQGRRRCDDPKLHCPEQ